MPSLFRGNQKDSIYRENVKKIFPFVINFKTFFSLFVSKSIVTENMTRVCLLMNIKIAQSGWIMKHETDQDYFILIPRNKIVNWFKSDYAACFLLLSYAHSSSQCGSSHLLGVMINGNFEAIGSIVCKDFHCDYKTSVNSIFWRELINWIFETKLLRLKKVIEGVPWKFVWGGILLRIFEMFKRSYNFRWNVLMWG